MRSYFIMNGRELIFIFCFIVTIISGQQDEHAICRSKNTSAATWTCKRIADCKLSSKLLNTPQEYRCGLDKRREKICCPEKRNATQTTKIKPTQTPKPTSATPKYIRIINEKCTDFAKARYRNECIGGVLLDQEPNCTVVKDCKQTTVTLIVHGKQVEQKEFPHMTLIGYGEELSDVEWNCGGSLISERFVLTAAHCAKTSVPAKWVGLGLLSRERYTTDVLDENIFPIAKTHVHPGYRKPFENNDIALFELQNPLTFSPYIRPICLHTEPDIPQEALNNATIVGWGKIAAGSIESEALLKATITFFPSNSCETIYAKERKLRNGFDGKTMICAGDTERGEIGTIRDTCQGDSGGPIQMNHKEECLYLQTGITSIGSDFCGNGTPAIYTRVYSYLEWIQKIVWPEK